MRRGKLIYINQDKCIGCQSCAKACPVRVLEMDSDQKAFVKRPTFCIRCAHCLSVCPSGAVSSDFEDSVPDKSIKGLDMPSTQQVENLILTRRGIRSYSKQAIPREMIEKLLLLAAQAPTARNAQDVKYIVVSDPDKTKELEKLAQDYFRAQKNDNIGVITREAGFELLLGAPVTIGFYAEKREQGNANEALWNCLIAAQNLLLAAHGMGLGGCYNGLLLHAYRNKQELKSFFDMPKKAEIYMFVVIGYPDPDIYYSETIARKLPQVIWK